MSFFLKISKAAEAADSSNYPAPVKDDGYPYLYGSAGGDSWISGAQYGTVGGDSAGTDEIQVRVKIGSAAEADGWILRQKGRSKFLVTDGTNTGVCSLADLADSALTANTMTVTCTKQDTSTFRVAAIKNKRVIDFNGVAYLTTPSSGSRSATPPAGSNASGGVVTPALR